MPFAYILAPVEPERLDLLVGQPLRRFIYSRIILGMPARHERDAMFLGKVLQNQHLAERRGGRLFKQAMLAFFERP